MRERGKQDFGFLAAAALLTALVLGGAYHAVRAITAEKEIAVLERARSYMAEAAGFQRRLSELEDRLAEIIEDANALFSIEGRTFEGLASWYGPGFAGKFTASGEVFDTRKLTAAHRSLALGTIVRVENPRNGRAVIVKINDRGPFHDDRVIDLSPEAAARIGMLGRGIMPVRVTIVSWPTRELLSSKPSIGD